MSAYRIVKNSEIEIEIDVAKPGTFVLWRPAGSSKPWSETPFFSEQFRRSCDGLKALQVVSDWVKAQYLDEEE